MTIEQKSIKTVNIVKLRDEFAEYVNLAKYGKERILIFRRGKPVAAIVSIQDLRILDQNILTD
jgi:prevent-host-death family protein